MAILSLDRSTPLAVLELLDHPVDDALVPVVTTEVVVAGGGLDLDDALADLEQGHVERAATEVEDQDRLVVALVEAVGQRGRGRLVDDALDVEARDLAGLLGGLALGVVEVRRHGDDRVGDGLAEVGLGVALELLQHERADLLRGEVLPSILTFQSVPMWRLTDRMVRSTLVTAWRLATSPTSTSPFLAKATTDGVVRAPSALAMTVGSPPSRTATTELVVPRSMPGHHPAGAGRRDRRPGRAYDDPPGRQASGGIRGGQDVAAAASPARSTPASHRRRDVAAG